MSDLLSNPLNHSRTPASWRRFLLLLLATAGLLSYRPARAQVLDDSTKVRFGPKTTRVIREADVMREQYEGRMVDTTLTNLPDMRFWAHDTTFQQDLGNVGTASRPLLWQPNVQLGARLGRNVFDRYVRDAANIPYYDTRSPYTFFRFFQSSEGEQVFELSYTRSIKKNANVGVAYERYASNKILAAQGIEGLVNHVNFLVFGRYQSTDDRYYALINFSTARHTAPEQGGIRPLTRAETTIPDSVPSQLFDYRRERIWLSGSQVFNREARDQLHLAHTYKLLGRGLTAFHVFDWRRQYNEYSDDKLVYERDTLRYYPVARLSPVETRDRAEWRQVENTFGVLGRSNAVEYRLYARRRDASLVTRTALATDGPASLVEAFPDRRFGEWFLGGTAAFRYKIFAVETAGEFKLIDQYWVRAAARFGPLTGEAFSSSYAPTITEQEFNGNHYAWQNDFLNTKVNQFTLRYAQTVAGQQLTASAAVVNINSLVYYSQTGRPAQLSEGRNLLIGTLRHRAHFGSVYTDNVLTLTGGGEGPGIRIPPVAAYSKVYFQGALFKKALFGQVGADVYFQSRWRAYDYSPSTQQFYLQDEFTIRGYPVVGAFLTADIKTVSIFLKGAYLNQGLGGNGYFTTPYYTGLPRRFQFGIRWQFFD
ncbi:putative porin [Hymenobacter sp. BT175]|uniref:putative porin n=1 Tax=Hymenobacter translucens TaxID=2886507 RepID=UPI001D0ED500|nr:putative porin [Hymenobacter translucens]MCC2546277.1 putative porin [Hymenobacter translucens]